MKLLIDEALKKKKNIIYCTKHHTSQNRIEYSLWVGDDPLWKNINPTVESILQQKETLTKKYDIKPLLQYLEHEHIQDVNLIPHFLFHDDTIEILKIKIKKYLRCRDDELLHLWCDQEIEYTPFYADLLTTFLFESANSSDQLPHLLTCNFGDHPYPLQEFVASFQRRPIDKKEWTLHSKELLNQPFIQSIYLGMSQYPFFWIKQNTANPFLAFPETDFSFNDRYHPYTQLGAYEHIVGNVISVTNVATGYLPYYKPTLTVKFDSNAVLEQDREFQKAMNNTQRELKTDFTKFLLLDCIININFQDKKNPTEIDLNRIYERLVNTPEIPYKRLKRSKEDIVFAYYKLGEVDEKKHQIITSDNIDKWTNRKGTSDNPNANLHGLMIKQYLFSTNTERIYNTIHIYKDGKISIRIPLQQDLQEQLYRMIHLSIQNCKELILSIIQLYQLNINLFPPDSKLHKNTLTVSNNVQFGNINFAVYLKPSSEITKATLEDILGCGSPPLVWKQIKKSIIQHFYLKRKKDLYSQSNILLWIREFKTSVKDQALEKLLMQQFMIPASVAKQLITLERSDVDKHKTRFQSPTYGVSMEVPNQEGGEFKILVKGCDSFKSINTILCVLQYLFFNEEVKERCVIQTEEVGEEEEQVSDEIKKLRQGLPKYPYKKKTTYGLVHEADKQMFTNYSDALLSGKPRKDGTRSWATTCQNGKQPIPIRDESFLNRLVDEKKINREQGIVQYGENQNYYICPDAWCYNCQYAFTRKEVEADIPCINKECKVKTYQGFRCPICKTEPKGQKCTTCKSKRPDSELQLYMPESPKLIYPGFMEPIMNEHTKQTHCAVCCFKNNPKTKLQKERRELCNKLASKELIEDTQTRQKTKNEQLRSYVATSFTLENNQYGVFHKELWELLGNPKGSVLFDKQGIRRNAPKAFFRKGLSFSQNHSFLQVFVYFYNERYPQNKVTSWSQLVNKVIIPNLTPFVLVKAKKGLLLSIFTKDHIPITDELLSTFPSWVNSHQEFIKYFGMDDTLQEVNEFVKTQQVTPNVQVLLRVHDCQQNLIAYLQDEHIHHHYRFLWELLILPNVVIPEGINLFIFEHEIHPETKEESINYVCPFHSETSSFYNFKYGFFAMVIKKKDVNETFELLVQVQTNSNYELQDRALLSMSHFQTLFSKLFTKLVYGCVSYPQVNFWKSNDKEIVITVKNVYDMITGSEKELKSHGLRVMIQGQLLDYFLQAYALVVKVEEEKQPEQLIIFPIRRTELLEGLEVYHHQTSSRRSSSANLISSAKLIPFEKLEKLLQMMNDQTKNIFLLSPKYKIVSHHEVNAIKLENNVILPIRPLPTTHLPSAVKSLPTADIKYYLETDHVITNEDEVVEDERLRYMMEHQYFWKTYKQLCFQLSKKLNQQDKSSIQRQQRYDQILIPSKSHKQKLQPIYQLLREDLDELIKVQPVSKQRYVQKKIYVNCQETTVKQCQQGNTICAVSDKQCIIPIVSEDDYDRMLRFMSNEIVNNYWFRNQVIYHQYKPQDIDEHLVFTQSSSSTMDKARLLEEASLMQQYVQRRDAYIETMPRHDLQHYHLNTRGVKISIPYVWKNALSDYFFILENPNEGVVGQNRYIIEKLYSESDLQTIGKQVAIRDIQKFYGSFPSHITDFHSLLGPTDRFQYSQTEQDFWNNFRKGETKSKVLSSLEKGTYHFTVDDLRWLSFYFGLNIIVLNFHVKTILYSFNPTCQRYDVTKGNIEPASTPYSVIVLYDEQLRLFSLLSVIMSNHRSEIRIPPHELPVGLRLYMEKKGLPQVSPEVVPSPTFVTPLPSPVSSPKVTPKRQLIKPIVKKTKKVQFREEEEEEEPFEEDLMKAEDLRRKREFLQSFQKYDRVIKNGNNLIHAVRLAYYDRDYIDSRDKEERSQEIRERVFRELNYAHYEQFAMVRKVDDQGRLKNLPNHVKSKLRNTSVFDNQEKLDPVYVLALSNFWDVNILVVTEEHNEYQIYPYLPIWYDEDKRTIMLLYDEKNDEFIPLYRQRLEFLVRERNATLTRMMRNHVLEVANQKIPSNGVLRCSEVIVDKESVGLHRENQINFCGVNEMVNAVVTPLNNGIDDDYITFECSTQSGGGRCRYTKKRYRNILLFKK